MSGSTSLDHARNQIPEIETQPVETLGVVVMTTGGNDLIHLYGRTPPAEGAMYGATMAQVLSEQPFMTHRLTCYG